MYLKQLIAIILIKSLTLGISGILNVSLILMIKYYFLEMFLKYLKIKNLIDYSWVNEQDGISFIEPTVG